MLLMKVNGQAEHRPGTELVIAEGLSRNPLTTNSTMEDYTAENEVEAFVDAVQDTAQFAKTIWSI